MPFGSVRAPAFDRAGFRVWKGYSFRYEGFVAQGVQAEWHTAPRSQYVPGSLDDPRARHKVLADSLNKKKDLLLALQSFDETPLEKLGASIYDIGRSLAQECGHEKKAEQLIGEMAEFSIQQAPQSTAGLAREAAQAGDVERAVILLSQARGEGSAGTKAFIQACELVAHRLIKLDELKKADAFLRGLHRRGRGILPGRLLASFLKVLLRTGKRTEMFTVFEQNRDTRDGGAVAVIMQDLLDNKETSKALDLFRSCNPSAAASSHPTLLALRAANHSGHFRRMQEIWSEHQGERTRAMYATLLRGYVDEARAADEAGAAALLSTMRALLKDMTARGVGPCPTCFQLVGSTAFHLNMDALLAELYDELVSLGGVPSYWLMWARVRRDAANGVAIVKQAQDRGFPVHAACYTSAATQTDDKAAAEAFTAKAKEMLQQADTSTLAFNAYADLEMVDEMLALALKRAAGKADGKVAWALLLMCLTRDKRSSDVLKVLELAPPKPQFYEMGVTAQTTADGVRRVLTLMREQGFTPADGRVVRAVERVLGPAAAADMGLQLPAVSSQTPHVQNILDSLQDEMASGERGAHTAAILAAAFGGDASAAAALDRKAKALGEKRARPHRRPQNHRLRNPVGTTRLL